MDNAEAHKKIAKALENYPEERFLFIKFASGFLLALHMLEKMGMMEEYREIYSNIKTFDDFVEIMEEE